MLAKLEKRGCNFHIEKLHLKMHVTTRLEVPPAVGIFRLSKLLTCKKRDKFAKTKGLATSRAALQWHQLQQKDNETGSSLNKSLMHTNLNRLHWKREKSI